MWMKVAGRYLILFFSSFIVIYHHCWSLLSDVDHTLEDHTLPSCSCQNIMFLYFRDFWVWNLELYFHFSDTPAPQNLTNILSQNSVNNFLFPIKMSQVFSLVGIHFNSICSSRIFWHTIWNLVSKCFTFLTWPYLIPTILLWSDHVEVESLFCMNISPSVIPLKEKEVKWMILLQNLLLCTTILFNPINSSILLPIVV
jgi:hypothetical protein